MKRRLRAGLVLAVFMFVCGFSPVGSALSPEQRRIIDSGIRYFDIEKQTNPLGCRPGSSSLVGSDNEEKVWNFLVSHQLTPVQAAGVMGNLAVEAGFEPRLVEYGWLNSRGEVSQPGQPSSLDDNIPPNQNSLGQPGYGIVQWTSPDRKQGLQNKSDNDPSQRGVSDLGLQLEYMYEEAVARGDWEKQQQETTVEGSTYAWHSNYERSADGPERIQNRVNIAHSMLEKYGSTTPTTSNQSGNSVSCATAGRGEVVGGFSLPVDRNWYDQYPEWFSEPHHSSPPASDIPVPEGTAIYSISSGVVVLAPVGGNCGEGIIIDSDNGITYMYCHGVDGGLVSGARVGDTVQPGQLIMTSGNTGRSTGPHLHVEIRVNGQNRCPQPMFEGIANGTPPDPATLPDSGCVK